MFYTIQRIKLKNKCANVPISWGRIITYDHCPPSNFDKSFPTTLKDDIGFKPLKVTSIQRRERVKSARKLLKRLGATAARSNWKWKQLLNTVIWSKSKRTIPIDLQTVGEEKYSPGVLLYGELTSHDLIPIDSLIFIDDWLKLFRNDSSFY